MAKFGRLGGNESAKNISAKFICIYLIYDIILSDRFFPFKWLFIPVSNHLFVALNET